MKGKVLPVAVFLLSGLVAAQAQRGGHRRGQGGPNTLPQQFARNGTVYATADDGTPLKWVVFPASGPGPHPALLIIYGGRFVEIPTSPNALRAAREAAAEGFNAFVVEYRLAPPGGLPGQKSSGRFPEQTNDLRRAVRAARAYPGGNGKVGAIGGSAGATHAVYLAATGTKGDDRVDAAVGLSGAYDLTDPQSLADPGFRRSEENYVGSSSQAELKKASPVSQVDAKVSPLFLIASDDETMPPEQLPDLVRRLKEVGVTNFRQRVFTNSHRHSFSNWPRVSREALDFLKKNLGAADAGAGEAAAPSPSTASASSPAPQ
jgi:acetyl esterase/lipase